MNDTPLVGQMPVPHPIRCMTRPFRAAAACFLAAMNAHAPRPLRENRSPSLIWLDSASGPRRPRQVGTSSAVVFADARSPPWPNATDAKMVRRGAFCRMQNVNHI